MQVTAEVRSTARAVETNFKRVQSTRAARVLQERRLDAETKKFGAGMSTNFLVTQSQRDLAVAEVAELRAIADYRRSLVELERVQRRPGGAAAQGAWPWPRARGSITTRRRLHLPRHEPWVTTFDLGTAQPGGGAV